MNSNNLTQSSVNKIYKKAQDALKVSYIRFKFSPEYIEAVSYFTEAAEGYKKLSLYKESLKSYEEAIKCNKHLLESWPEATNWQNMSEIAIFNLSDFNKGWEYLQNSSLAYKLSGKFTSGIKVYIDFAQRLIENNKMFPAVTILEQAVEDCFDQSHDQLVRISLEDTFNRLLDVYCQVEKYVDAINLIEKYIKYQKGVKDEAKYKITKNYVKLGMLRIIIGELYMSENIIDEMFSVYDSSCADDVDDLKKLNKSVKDGNKKDFNFLITYAFSLFQNNLLKSLKKAFEKMMEERIMSQPVISDGGMVSVDAEGGVIGSDSNYNDDETRAESNVGESGHDNAGDYL